MRKYIWPAAALALAALLALGFGLPGTRMDQADMPTGAGTPGAAMVTVTLPAQLSETARLGKQAFDAVCATCHGANAAGNDGKGPPLVHKIYEPSHHGDLAFHLAVQNGVRAHHWRFGNMPPQDGLTRADVEAIVAYVRALQRENGID